MEAQFNATNEAQAVSNIRAELEAALAALDSQESVAPDTAAVSVGDPAVKAAAPATAVVTPVQTEDPYQTIEHALPPVEAAVSDVENVVKSGEAVFTAVTEGNIPAVVSDVESAGKSVEDLIREIHTEVMSLKPLVENAQAFISSMGEELAKQGPMAVIGALLKGAL